MRSKFVGIVVVFTAMAVHAQQEAPFPPAPSTVSSVAIIVGKDEPGEPLHITGRVYQSDRKTLYAGLVLYFYQTDVTGVYNRTDNFYGRPRLFGWAKTDESGNYEIRTIKPGSYPRRNEAAHIHVTVKLPGSRAQWLESFLFHGDPNLSESERRQPGTLGRLSPVLRISKDKDGVLHAARDLVMPKR